MSTIFFALHRVSAELAKAVLQDTIMARLAKPGAVVG